MHRRQQAQQMDPIKLCGTVIAPSSTGMTGGPGIIDEVVGHERAEQFKQRRSAGRGKAMPRNSGRIQPSQRELCKLSQHPHLVRLLTPRKKPLSSNSINPSAYDAHINHAFLRFNIQCRRRLVHVWVTKHARSALECCDPSQLFRLGNLSPEQGRVQRCVVSRMAYASQAGHRWRMERSGWLTATSRLRKAGTSPRTPRRGARGMRKVARAESGHGLCEWGSWERGKHSTGLGRSGFGGGIHFHSESHSSTNTARPRIASTCRSNMRTCGTENSELVGMVWRCWPRIMN